jgi:ubiquinone/menaquinone biosynthesis C-methylase UbiE
MKRIANREYARWGDRVCKGGDMYESQKKFREFASTRDVGLLEQAASLYLCPILRIDSSKTPKENIDEVLTHINTCDHYDALIEENNAPVYDPPVVKAYMDKWDGNAFIDEMYLTGKEDVLEIGMGTGRIAMRICDKCWSFTGIDISPNTIERAKENLRIYPNVRLICDEFLSHSFDESFDVIYSSLTFMHIKDKKAVVQKAASLLNQGGQFVLSIEKNQQTEIDYGSRKITVYPDTVEEITVLFTKAGLNIEKQFETEFAVIFTAKKG